MEKAVIGDRVIGEKDRGQKVERSKSQKGNKIKIY